MKALEEKEENIKTRMLSNGYNEMNLEDLGHYIHTGNLEKYKKETRDRDPTKKDVTLHFSGTNYLWLSHDCYKGNKELKGKSEMRLRSFGMLEPRSYDVGKIWLIFKCEKCSFKARLQICLWGNKLKIER